MSALLCWFVGHRPLPGVLSERSLCFWCERCERVVPGAMAVRR